MSPFRTNYLKYEEISRIVHDWAKANPGLVRVKSIGKSVEGRDLWCITINNPKTGPDRSKPAIAKPTEATTSPNTPTRISVPAVLVEPVRVYGNVRA